MAHYLVIIEMEDRPDWAVPLPIVRIIKDMTMEDIELAERVIDAARQEARKP
ncbi:hypothetical protein ES703_15121 [subsurface metagenome]